MANNSTGKGSAAAEAIKILRLLRLLPVGASATTAQLAARLEAAGTPMSERALQRTLRALADAPDFPVICDERDRSHRWGWDEKAPALTVPEPDPADAALCRLAGRTLADVLAPALMKSLRPHLFLTEAPGLPVCVLPDALPRVPAGGRPEVLRAAANAHVNRKALKIRYREKRRTLEAVVTVLGLCAAAHQLWLVLQFPKEADPRSVPLRSVIEARVTVFDASDVPDFSVTAFSLASPLNPNRGELVRLAFVTADEALTEELRTAPLAASQTMEKLKTTPEDAAAASHVRVSVIVPDSPLLSAWLTLHADRIQSVERKPVIGGTE